MPHRTDPRQKRARLLYADSSISQREVARRAGVSISTLTRWAKRNGWPRGAAPTDAPAGAAAQAAADTTPDTERNVDASTEPSVAKRKGARGPVRKAKRPKVKTLVDRLYRIITHNLELMENRMSDDGTSATDDPERDIRAIGNIVRSVEKLREIEPDTAKRDTSKPNTGTSRTDPNSGRAFISADEEERIRRVVVEHILKLRERKRREDGDSSTS